MSDKFLEQRLSHQLDGLKRDVGQISQRLRQPPPRDKHFIEALADSISRRLVPIKQILAELSQGNRLPIASKPFSENSSNENDVRSAVQSWSQVRQLLETILAEPQWPLMPSPMPKQSLRGAQTVLADDLFNLLHVAVSNQEQSDDTYQGGAFADIGLNNSTFVELLHAAYRLRLGMGAQSTRFLDVGCGAGIKLIGASWFFSQVHGIEVDPAYVEAGCRLLGNFGASAIGLVQQDAFSFNNYGQFDVVYLFRPISDSVRMKRLEEIIVAETAPKTILLCPYKDFEKRHKDYACVQLDRGLFLTQSTQVEAEELLTRTSFVGLAVQPFRTSSNSLWAEILEAAHDWGFENERPTRLEGI